MPKSEPIEFEDAQLNESIEMNQKKIVFEIKSIENKETGLCETRTATDEICEEIGQKNARKIPKKAIKWDEQETIYLIFLVEKLGRAWAKITSKYKKYFKNRNARDLKKKYYTLKKNNKDHFENLKEKSKNLNESDFMLDKIIEKKMYVRWDDEEITYLVHGVETLGKNWVSILTTFKAHFKEDRSGQDLCDKYRKIERNFESLEHFKRLSKLLPERKNLY